VEEIMAGSFNKTILVGRLGKDPRIAYTASGTAICSFSLATDESFVKDGNKTERVEWHSVTVFGKHAENCSKYLSKGSLVLVEGSLYTEKWQDKDGKDRFTTKIKAQSVQFLDTRTSRDEGQQERRPETQPAQPGPYNNQDLDDAPF